VAGGCRVQVEAEDGNALRDDQERARSVRARDEDGDQGVSGRSVRRSEKDARAAVGADQDRCRLEEETRRAEERARLALEKREAVVEAARIKADAEAEAARMKAEAKADVEGVKAGAAEAEAHRAEAERAARDAIERSAAAEQKAEDAKSSRPSIIAERQPIQAGIVAAGEQL